jgi:hypothetical protein
MTVVVSRYLLLAPATITAGTVAMVLGLVLVRLAQQAAGSWALRTLSLMVSHPWMVA